MQWLRERRQAEPASPVGVLVAVILLVVVVLGIGGFGPRLLHGGKAERPSVGLLTPANPSAAVPSSEISSPSPASSASASSPRPSATPPPVMKARASAADITAASRVAVNWGRAFYTRRPATETYQQLVDRTRSYMTSAVAASFASAGDPTYEALKKAHGTSRVVTITSVQPRAGTAPVDTPSRITRLLTLKIQITGARPVQISLPLMITLTGGKSHWLVSDVNGGTGT
ncbi:MAG TPA: hypothetical protein VEL02_09680 [Jatrophihabitantaceae bacterium]|nr:hypothetical protein [Jatrophihabitantaceae bacterium]